MVLIEDEFTFFKKLLIMVRIPQFRRVFGKNGLERQCDVDFSIKYFCPRRETLFHFDEFGQSIALWTISNN